MPIACPLRERVIGEASRPAVVTGADQVPNLSLRSTHQGHV
ncbi:hypothetical protein J2Y66_001171 [Paenarthrobacter nitroguajacolicus]|nr:hypothetical protein [Paenarthrobacter nitroguajacolicus]